jgi:RNA recognition motif. (a.k.a. RRM, RBD, or RNP domain)
MLSILLSLFMHSFLLTFLLFVPLNMASVQRKFSFCDNGFSGCCFVKYATHEEAERATRALHNQYALPGVSAWLASVSCLNILIVFVQIYYVAQGVYFFSFCAGTWSHSSSIC